MSYSSNIFLYFILIISIAAEPLSLCGDWVTYKDEKCYKVLDNHLMSYDEAKNACYQLQASDLLSIRSQEEQDFLFNLLNNDNNIANNVWLSMESRACGGYKWIDSSPLIYTNWAKDNPVNESSYDCVQLVLNQPYNGQWFNKPCNKRNVVVCEKMPKWNSSYLQKTIIEMRNEFKSTKSDLETQLENTKSDLENTKTELESTKIYFETTKTDLQSEIVKATPAGTIAYFARSSPPLGWLKADGKVVSRSTYSSLFASIGITFGSGDGSTTFTLPDLRGEFIRSWSDGRNVDTNRSFGRFQWGSSIPLASYVSGSAGRAIASGFQDRWGFAGQTFDNGYEAHIPSGQTRDGLTFPSDDYSTCVAYINTNAGGSVSTWNVMKGTRPRNIALLACIKY